MGKQIIKQQLSFYTTDIFSTKPKINEIKYLIYSLLNKLHLHFLNNLIFLWLLPKIMARKQHIEDLFWKLKIFFSSYKKYFSEIEKMEMRNEPIYKTFLLYSQAAKVRDGCIVEIGSFKGKSTIALALGAKQGKGNTVFAVDPFKPYEEMITKKITSGYFVEPDSNAFTENLEKFQVDDIVVPVKKTSSQAAKKWNKKIGLLFIDGNHEFGFVKQDFLNWEKFLVMGGTVIFDDTHIGFPGPVMVVREFLTKEKFSKIVHLRHMAYAIKK